MRRTKSTLLITGFAVFAVLVVWNLRLIAVPSGAAAPGAPGDDPDLPPQEAGQGIIDKQQYLQARQEYFASRRGWEVGERVDPLARARAILRVEAEEQEILTNLKAAAAVQGPESRAAQELKVSLTSWTELGPAPIPNGQTEVIMNTPVSGRTTAIAVHPTNSQIVFVGTAQGGLYRSLDGGDTWTPMLDTAQSLAIGAVAFSPSDPTIVYVGTGEANLSADSFFGVGLYRINDALGATPTLTGPINPPVATAIPGTTAFSGVSISKIVVHPTDPATIFVSSAQGTSSNPSGGSLATTVPPLAMTGIYRSTNATAPLPDVAFSKLTVTSAGSVAPDTSGNRNIIDMVMEPGVPNKLICTVLGTSGSNPPDGGVYVSTDALAPAPTFTRTLALGNAASVVANEGRAELAINKTNGIVTVYVASGESAAAAAGPACGTGGTLRRSTDGGNTWTLPLPAADGFCAAQCFYDIALAVDPTNPLVVLLGGNVTGPCTKLIARSNDGGATFDPAPAAGVHADNQVVVFAPSDPLVAYMGTDGGIYKSTTGGNTWASMNNTTFRATQFQSIGTHPTDRQIMLGGTQDNGTIMRRADGTWSRTDSGDGGYALFDRNGTSTTGALAYHTYQNGGTLLGWARSTNSGASWTQRNCPANGIPCNEPVLFYAPIALGPGNPNTFYFGTDRLWRSTDGMVVTAASQKPLATDAVPPAAPVNQVLTTIAISPLSDNVRLAGLRNGKVFGTSEGSTTLTDLTTADLPKPNEGTIRRAVSRAIFSTTDPKTAYITFGGYNVDEGEHIWKTTNFDTTAGAPAVVWTPSGFGIPDVPVNSIVIDRLAPNNMYAATDIGVFRSADSGETWAPFNTGLPRIAIFDLAFQEQQATPNQSERILRAATHGRGIWEIVIPTPVQITSIVSRKTHTGAGVFDVDLPLGGSAGVEPRTGGANGNHTLVFSFGSAVTVSGVTVAPGPGGMAEVDGPVVVSPNGQEVTVNLRNVSNAQTLTVTLNGVTNAAGTSNVSAVMGVLLGDSNADGTVNSGDATQTRNRSGQAASAGTFRSDVNLDGTVNSGDAFIVRQRSGTTINP